MNHRDQRDAASSARRDATLLIGRDHSGEFAEAVALLDDATHLLPAPDPAAAVAKIADSATFPPLVVWMQSRPGQFTGRQIERVRRAAPLAAQLMLQGSCCEGERRSGTPWPGVLRLYWHQAAPQIAQELERRAAGCCPHWSTPATSTDDDRWLLRRRAASIGGGALVVIDAQHAIAAESLTQTLAAAGYAAVWFGADRQAHAHGVAAGVIDTHRNSTRRAAQIASLAARIAPAPVIALLNFPRTDDVRRAKQAGAAAVLSKPFVNDDLLWLLTRSLGHRAALPADAA